jgi:hypothetical protein
VQVQGIPRLVVVAPDGRVVVANAVQTPLSLAQLDAWSRPSTAPQPSAAAACGTRKDGCCGGGCSK